MFCSITFFNSLILTLTYYIHIKTLHYLDASKGRTSLRTPEQSKRHLNLEHCLPCRLAPRNFYQVPDYL